MRSCAAALGARVHWTKRYPSGAVSGLSGLELVCGQWRGMGLQGGVGRLGGRVGRVLRWYGLMLGRAPPELAAGALFGAWRYG